METGQWSIEPATIVLQGEHAGHCVMAFQARKVYKRITSCACIVRVLNLIGL